MKSERKCEIKLRPDAPVFVPFVNNNKNNIIKALFPQVSNNNKEAQCSRYSRKYVRRVDDSPNSPRPILGVNNSVPRPILGRKENLSVNVDDDDDDDGINNNKENEKVNYFGKEFRSIYRRIQRLKIADDRKVKRKN